MNNCDFTLGANKFFFYAMNYRCVDMEYPTLFNGNVTKCIPEFFKAFEPSDVEHLLNKWEYAYEKYGSTGAMMHFYGELDGTKRVKMLFWINENYNMSETFGLRF